MTNKIMIAARLIMLGALISSSYGLAYTLGMRHVLNILKPQIDEVSKLVKENRCFNGQ